MLPAETIHLTLDSRIDNQPVPLGAGASMTILHADGAPYPSPNDNSLVIRLDLGTTRVLLMSDAQAGGRADPSTAPTPSSIEGALLACCTSDLAAQVLVVGHHGSMTSSRKAFICALYDVGEQAGTAHLVMQYLEGETLQDRLTKGAIPWRTRPDDDGDRWIRSITMNASPSTKKEIAC